MGLFSWLTGKNKELVRIENLVRDIQSLSFSERKLFLKELSYKYKNDYKLTEKEIIQVLKFLFVNKDISEIDLKSILVKLDISYSKYSQTKLESFFRYNRDSNKKFDKSDIKKKLYGIRTLDSKEKAIVTEALTKEYKDDGKLEVREIVITIKKLYKERKISEHDRDSIFKRFNITRGEINKY